MVKQEILDDREVSGVMDGVVGEMEEEDLVVVMRGILLLLILGGNHMGLVRKDGGLDFGVGRLLELLLDTRLGEQEIDNRNL